MNLRRSLTATAAVVVLALTVVGCSGDDGDDDVATDGTGQTSDAPSEEASTPLDSPSTEAGEPTEGDEPSAADGDLPDWAPVVVTDDSDVVTGFDFTDTPAPGPELEVVLLREGDGAVVEAGQTISVNYLGQTYDGTDPDNEPFDGNYGAAPIQFPIGAGAVIEGWDQSLVGQKIGSRVLMSIPSDLGYGDAGYPPVIPGGATLYFVVDIVDAA